MPVRALIQAHETYKKKREDIKARHRIELENELLPEKEALGKEIAEMNKEGLNMVEITEYLGLKNRNYTYEMLRHFTKEPIRGKKKAEQDEPEKPTIPYQWIKNEHSYTVTVGNEHWYVDYTEHGDLIIPDDWATRSDEERAIFKKIIREITLSS